MHVENCVDPTGQWIGQAADRWLQEKPALETVIRPFSAILIEKASISQGLKNMIGPLDAVRVVQGLASGIPMVLNFDSGGLKRPMDKALADMLPVLARVFPTLEADLSAITGSLGTGAIDAGILAKAYLEGDSLAFRSQSKKMGAAEETAGFVVNWALSAVLNTARITWTDAVGPFAWYKGFCPLCGSLPAIGFFAKPDSPSAEHLVGGGGQRYLFCALCGHQWRFERNRCPVCDTDDKEKLCYYQVSGEIGERIDACGQCGHYLLCLDLRRWALPPPMEVAAVGMIHLDIVASDHGFRPMAWTPWNRLGDL